MGLAAITALGAYFLSGEKGARNRKRVFGWTLKMKGEVLEKIESMRTMDRETYLRIVDQVASRYAKLDNINASEMQHLTVELKNAWAHINKKVK